MFNKKISQIKLTITTSCNLDCDYCFVKKTNRKMGILVAKKAVDFLVQTPGEDKFLKFFGGEPFLNFELIKKIVPYTLKQAKNYQKNIIFSICTNATCISKEKLNFLKEYDIKLTVSLAGPQRIHDSFRYFHNKKGSYKLIRKNLSLISQSLPLKNLGISFCIFPSLSYRLYKDFCYIIKLGFNYINLEIIRDFEVWSDKAISNFIINLNKIITFILANISKKRFIFLNPVNWELKYKILSDFSPKCPFKYDLEVYPSGEIAFSPFLLNLPEREKRKFIIGNIKKGFKKNYQECFFNSQSAICQTCEIRYYQDYRSDKSANLIYQLYQAYSLKIAKEIKFLGSFNKNFSNYIQKIKEKICF